MLGRVSGVDPQVQGGLVMFGAARATDAAVLVRRVRAAQANEVEAILAQCVGPSVKRSLSSDGVLVATGSPSLIRRCGEVLDRLEGVQRNQWVVQFYLVSLTAKDAAELGLDTIPQFDIAVAQAHGYPFDSIKVRAGLSAVLRASAQRSSVRLVAKPLFLLADGSTVKYDRATRFPFKTQSIVPLPIGGTTGSIGGNNLQSQSGVSFVSVGTMLDVTAKEVREGELRCKIELEMSDVVEVGEDGLPRVESRNFSTAAVLAHGGVFLIGSFELEDERSSRGTWLQKGFAGSANAELLQIWAQVQDVTGDSGAPDELPDMEVQEDEFSIAE